MPEDRLPVAITETLGKAAVAVLVPYGGGAVVVWEAVRNRLAARMERTADEVLAAVGADTLAARLAQSPEFEALVVNALDAAARTGYEPKRRLLAQVVVNAAHDDARVDESALVAQALRDLDAPHVRALERLRLAGEALIPTDDPEKGSATSQRHRAINEAGRLEPAPILAALVRTGVAAPPMLVGGGVGVAFITDFGLAILDELHLAAQQEDAARAAGQANRHDAGTAT